MRNEEKKPVGSLLGQKVLEDEDTGLEKTVCRLYRYSFGFFSIYTTFYYPYNKMEFC